MSRPRIAKCEECGAEHGLDNYLWVFIDVDVNRGPLVHLNDGELAHGFERRDLCGQGCFHRHLDKLLFPDKPVPMFVEPAYKPKLYEPCGKIMTEDDAPF